MGHTLGDRLRYVRKRRDLTQRQLAEKAGVSIDVVTRLEQGQRSTARLTTLARLARALDVDVSALLAPVSVLNRPADNGRGGLLELRRALTSGELPGLDDHADGDEPPSVVDLEAAADHMWTLYQDGRYAEVGRLLPDVLVSLRHAIAETSGDEQRRAAFTVSHLYHVASGVATMLGKDDLAYVATECALDAGKRAGDEVLVASAYNLMAWIFRRQGRYEDCEQLAVKAAESIEPSYMNSEKRQLSVFGSLLANAAGAAARDETKERSEELLSASRAAAAALGEDVNYRWTVFGPARVASIAVENRVYLGEYGTAIRASRAVADGVLPPTWRARYLLDVAHAQCEKRRDDDALRTLLEIRRITPEWLRYHSLSKSLADDLLRRERARNTELREFATYVGLAG
jgi:transcriptional regulator with XRE-family HTH domain